MTVGRNDTSSSGTQQAQRLRVVILGIGAIARCIAESIGQIPRLTLVAGSCRTEAKGKAFAREFSCAWYADAQKMLAEERPDFAVVSTPSGAHLEAVELCAKHGIHVLCEKPLEITVARVQRMLQAASDNGVVLGAIFPQRFNRVNRLLRDAAAEDRFGQIACITGLVPWWREDSYYAAERWQGTQAIDGGGALINQAIHTIDLMQWIVGASMKDLSPSANPVEEVFARTDIRGHARTLLEVEDTAAVMLRFRNGAIGQLQAATSMYPGSLRRLIVGGRDGTAEVLEDQLIQYHFRHSRAADVDVVEECNASTQHAGGSGDPMAIVSSYHRDNIASFAASLEAGVTPEVSGVEAAKSIAIIKACYESARLGRPVMPREIVARDARDAPVQDH